jgi:enoyl-[acyl-carrier protein] reductase I
MFQVENKNFLITGVANKKSIAYFSAKLLEEAGAKVDLIVQNTETFEKVKSLFPHSKIYQCNVENNAELDHLKRELENNTKMYHGFLHSIAFANYSEGMKPFHETKLEDFLQATNISAYSLVHLTKIILPYLDKLEGSIVTMSISNTKATNYGYMGPIKAMLDSTVAFLAKSLSESTKIRVNAVCAGPLKTSASAGIPGYINGYLFSEQLTLRHEALKTEEVAQTVRFLLSPLSRGINAQGIVVDAGMSVNYFDQKVVDSYIKANF